MGKSVFDTIASPITGATHGVSNLIGSVGNSLGNVPVIGGALKYGSTGLGSAINSLGDAMTGNINAAKNDTLSSFSDAIHGVNTIPVVGPYVLPAVASIWGGPIGYAAASGVQNGFENARKGEKPGQAALGGAENAGISYVASQAGSALGDYAGNALNGTQLGSAFNSTPGENISSVVGQQNYGSVAPFGSIAGNALGGQTTAQLAGSALAQNKVNKSTAYTPPPVLPAPWQPTEQAASALPGSLSSYGSLNPQQQASNIASKGVYGGGNGPDEQNYFLNLMNRQLFDQSGNVASNTSGIAPVDLSYLNQLGISGSTPTDYLKGISQFAT